MSCPLYPSVSKTFKDSSATTCQNMSDNQSKSIIPWYGKLKAEHIPGIVEGGGIRKIFQKKYSKKTFHHVRVIP